MGKDSCSDSCDPCAPRPGPGETDVTTSASDVSVIIKNLYAQAVSPIKTGDAAATALGVTLGVQEIGSDICYATLDGNYGTTRLIIKSRLGFATLSHGQPVPIQGPGATIWLTGADRTSVACIRVSSSPVFLGPMRFREIGGGPFTSATVAAGTVPAAGIVLHHDGVSTPTYQVRTGTGLVDFTVLELVDPGDGRPVFTKAATSAALAANTVDSLPWAGNSTAYIAYFELNAGPVANNTVRVTQVIP